MKWRRIDGGYVSDDGEYVLVRGARMTHGCNAWLVHVRVGPDRIGQGTHTLFDDANGSGAAPLWRLDADGYVTVAEVGYDGPVYAHDWDAGWLSEAKAIIEHSKAACAARTETAP